MKKKNKISLSILITILFILIILNIIILLYNIITYQNALRNFHSIQIEKAE